MSTVNRTGRLVGKQFGRLTVLGERLVARRSVKCLCRCACGTEKEIYRHNLVSGETRSCGCLRAELRPGLCADQFRTHGHARDAATGKKTRTYQSWANMVQRCGNPKHRNYQDY